MHITLTSELYEKLSARVRATKEFASVDEYVNYVLGEVVKQMEGSSSSASSENTAYTKDQEEIVKKRLEDLGYLD